MHPTLTRFEARLVGDFDNFRQIAEQERAGKVTHPAARHVTRNINGKIDGLPADFDGFFVLEESYYIQNGRTNAMPHLFLFTLDGEGRVRLTSYETPRDLPRAQLTNDNPSLRLDYATLTLSEKFTPLVYTLDQSGVFYGRCVSQFSPDTVFTLEEWIGPESLLVTELMVKAGRTLVGVPSPIDYRRTVQPA